MNPGNLVQTKSGKVGRTFNRDPEVDGKIPVYLAEDFTAKDIADGFEPKTFDGLKLLCVPSTLTVIGFID
jgi:hypothetical protein